MRILHVIPWLAPRYGGPAMVLPDLCAALVRRGHDTAIMTTNVDGAGRLSVPLGRSVMWAGATTTFHGLSAPSWYLTSWSMLSDLRRRVGDYDIVHIHTLYRFHEVAAAVVARRRGIPYVIQPHGSLDPWHRNRRRVRKDLYHALIQDPIIRGASAVLCNSEREAIAIRDLGYAVPIWVIPNGIDTMALRTPAPSSAFPSGLVGSDGSVVTFLGRVSTEKGVPILVEAFIKTAARFPAAQLIIAGPDDEGIGPRLATLLAGAGLSDRSAFAGLVAGPAKRALLQRSDVFVAPSARESFGVAVAEAMAVGCPVVVTPHVAIEHMVRSTGAGIVAARDPVAIADAIATILADPAAARAMGEIGRREVDERFGWPVVAAQIESMYEAVVSVGRKPTRQRSAASESPRSVLTLDGPEFACPCCHQTLRASGTEWWCEACAWGNSMTAPVPILLPDPTLTEHDDLNRDRAQPHKATQAAHFDRTEEEAFEIERPHGTPRLYSFMLHEKLRRAIGPIRPHLMNATALTVCGGSGMDAEFLARAGANVISSDLSVGAATRAKARSDRYGLGIQSIVADVEHLPFADGSVDLVAVHDGLHHLDDPFAGLSEMARVARHWVIVTEPARATATRLAIWLGLAHETEEAGNAIARVEPSEVATYLQARGFNVLRAERYAMYYPHRPGALFRFLSRPFIFPTVRLGWRVANELLGRFGNKVVVVAERAQPPHAPQADSPCPVA